MRIPPGQPAAPASQQFSYIALSGTGALTLPCPTPLPPPPWQGSESLCRQLKTELEAKGKRPYVIPVGGSNPLGTWGYLEAVEEMRQQQGHIVSAQAADGGEEAERQQKMHHIEAEEGGGGGATGHDAAWESGQEGAGQGFFTDIAMVRERCF